MPFRLSLCVRRVHAFFILLTILAIHTVTSPPLLSVSNTIVISQVYGGGGNAGANYRNDFIELYNRGVTPVNVTGWSVQYASAPGSTWQRTNLSGTIQPGRYYLVQEARGNGGTIDLPAPDAVGTITMSATAGKVALVSNTTLLGGSCPLASVVDLVGYGSANCSEGSATASLSNTTAANRIGNGSIDTDDNSADFTIGPPAPHNSSGFPPTGTATANPPSALPAESTLLTVVVVPGQFPAAGGIVVRADLTPIGGAAAQSLFDDGTNGDLAAGDNVFSFQATVAPATAIGPKSLATTIADALARTTMTAASFTVEASLTSIHDIQGAGMTSPFAGQFVTTSGIVIGLKNNGLFLQTPDQNVDGNADTSEGLFVFTGAVPTGVGPGNMVRVSGTLTEFIPLADPFSPPLTEIGGGATPQPAVRLISTLNALPAATTLTAEDTKPAGALEQLERFEGMRVRVDSLRVVAPTQAAFIDEEHATSVSNGVFYGVIDGIARPLREPGIEVPDPLPAGAPCCVPRFDGNPERLRVDSDGQIGAAPLEVTSGALVTGLTGPLDYSFRTYTILPDPSSPPAVSGNATAMAVPAPDINEFTIGSFNMERFFDMTNHDDVDDVVLRPEAFEARLRKASLAIRNLMRSPDIIGVQEVENLLTLKAVADRINADTIAAGAPDPAYHAYLEEGTDVGGIDSGFLVKHSRVIVLDVEQKGKDATFLDPRDGSGDVLNDRPPLVLRADIPSPLGTFFPVTVIVNHLRSLSGIDGEDGARIRAKRRAQAEFLANLIQARQNANPSERIVSIGDYNAFHFDDGYVDVIGTIKGAPTPASQVVLASPDLVTPDLADVVETLSPGERYSFSFDGNAQALDHILINAPLQNRFSRLGFARNGADFPESFRNDATRPERLSDHDMPVAYFFFHKVPVLKLNGPNPLTVECHDAFVDPGATASDEDLGDLTLQIQVSGQVDPGVPGRYTLTYSVSNGVLTTTIVRTVIVIDATPPAVTAPSASPSMLLVPNHHLIPVEVSYGATDACDPNVVCTLSVESNEPVDGEGDGNTAFDWEIVDAHHVRLRAERDGRGTGRVYTITVTCRDASGNATVRVATVRVPKPNQR
jgi:predicted extracellular nuclease